MFMRVCCKRLRIGKVCNGLCVYIEEWAHLLRPRCQLFANCHFGALEMLEETEGG
jgi:hypothetical protein